MSTALATSQIRLRTVARRLPQLHEAVYRALSTLMPDGLSRSDCLVSRIPGAPDLYLQVLERHNYTTFLRLTYVLGESRHHNPNAHVRIYHDARMAEATAFSGGQGIHRLAGPELPARSLLERSWKLNRALSKWLDYLLAQGHGAATMAALEDTPDFLDPYTHGLTGTANQEFDSVGAKD